VRSVVRLALALALWLAAGGAAAAPQREPELERQIAQVAATAGGVVGVSIVHLPSGRAAGHNAGVRFPTASTCKLPLAVALLRRVDAGTLRLDAPVEVRRADLRFFGADTVRRRFSRKTGLRLRVSELLDAMILDSDNTATDLLFRLVGGPAAVERTLRELQAPGIDVSRSEGEIADWLESHPPQTAARAFEEDPRDTTTPEAMTVFLARLKRRELLSPASTDLLLELMRRCRTGLDRLRAELPPGTVVYDKTGTLQRTASDVGLITLPDGTSLAISVYLKSSRRGIPAREKTIAAIARVAYDAFVPRPALASRLAFALPRRPGS